MPRQLAVLVCDDVRVEFGGKFILIGMYMADIGIVGDVFLARQLVFLFIVEGEVSEPFKYLHLEVTFPGDEPRRLEFNELTSPVTVPDGRTKLIFRLPFVITDVNLRPGRIGVRVLHESGELSASVPWIIPVVNPISPQIPLPPAS